MNTRPLALLLALAALLPAVESGGLGLTATAPMVTATRTVSLRPVGALPPRVDLSPGFPVPMNQGQVGSCVACAIGYGIKSYQQAIDNPRVGIASTSGQFSPSFLYNQYGNGRDNGANPTLIFDIIGRRGVATLATMPYTTKLTTFPTQAQAKAALPYRAATVGSGDYPFYTSIPKTNLAAMKQKLAAGTPLAVGLRVDSAFDRLATATSFVWYPNNLAIRGWHELAIIGYDDAMTDGNGHVGAFRIQNSWGQGWGDHGRAWISYDALATVAVVDVGYGADRSAYVPTLTGTLTITHPRRGSLFVSVVVGSLSNPSWTYRYYLPSNADAQANLATELDLSEASRFWPPTPQRPWWICVGDAFADKSTGTVTAITLTNTAPSKVMKAAVTLPQRIPDGAGIAIPVTGEAPVAAPSGKG